MSEGWSRFALRFSRYYASLSPNDIWTPPRLRNREWMFIQWGDKPVDRHRGFSSEDSGAFSASSVRSASGSDSDLSALGGFGAELVAHELQGTRPRHEGPDPRPEGPGPYALAHRDHHHRLFHHPHLAEAAEEEAAERLPHRQTRTA